MKDQRKAVRRASREHLDRPAPGDLDQESIRAAVIAWSLGCRAAFLTWPSLARAGHAVSPGRREAAGQIAVAGPLTPCRRGISFPQDRSIPFHS